MPVAVDQSKDFKRVLVTGGSGLVGEAVKWALQQEQTPAINEEWFFASSKDADLRNIQQTKELFIQYRPTHVLHLAACVGGLFKNMRAQAQLFHDNIVINDNVISCAHEFAVKKCISCLSTCIFPDNVDHYPIDETMIHNGPPHDSNFGYAYAKRMIDIYNRSFYEQYGDKFTSVIPTNIFGPHDNFSIQDGHVIPGLMNKFLQSEQSGAKVIVAGSGNPLRQFIYSRDLAKLLLWSLREYEGAGQRFCDPVILSVDEQDELSINEVVQSIRRSLNFDPQRVVYDTSQADGQYRKTASNRKLRELLPQFKFTPFDVAIQETMDWFKANYAAARK